MSTFKAYREAYYDNSQRASENARQLAFAGVAFVWVLKADNAGLDGVPHALYLPTLLFAATLLLDFLQYAVASVIWGAYSRGKELQGSKADDDFKAPRWINLPVLSFFWIKQATLCWGYLALSTYLYQRIATIPG